MLLSARSIRCQLCSHRHKVHKFTRVWNTDLCDLCLKLNYMQHSFIEHFMVSSGHAHCGTHLWVVCVCVCVCVCLCVCVCVSQCTSFRALARLFEVYSPYKLLYTSSKLQKEPYILSGRVDTCSSAAVCTGRQETAFPGQQA